jgi:hypothetical protein
LATIDIAKPTDPQTGKAIEPEVRFTPGTISRPVPYKISIKPRSSEYENMIRQKAAALPWEDGHGDEI